MDEGKGKIFRFFTDPTAGLSIMFSELVTTCEEIVKGQSLREIRRELENERREWGIPRPIFTSTLRIGLYRITPMVDAYMLTRCRPESAIVRDIDDKLLFDDAPYTKRQYRVESADSLGFCNIERGVGIVWCARLVGNRSGAIYGFGVSRSRYEASERCVKRALRYLGLDLLREFNFEMDAFSGHKKALIGVGVSSQNIKVIPKRHAVRSELNPIEGVNSVVNRLYIGKHTYNAEASVYAGMVLAVADLTFWRTRTLNDGRLETTIADLLKIKNKPRSWRDLLLESYWNVLGTPSLFKLYGRFKKRRANKKPKHPV